MPRTGLPRDVLLAHVDAYRHQREVHRRAAEGTHARSVAAARMKHLETEFERLLHGWGAGEPQRQAWQNAFHHGAEPPDFPAPLPALLFKGRSASGAEVRAMRAKDGAIDIYVDGGMVRRTSALSLSESHGRTRFEYAPDMEFEEAFDAPSEAVDALRRWVADPSGDPPLEHAAALAADGLTDRYFALTPRGRRAIQARESVTV